MNGVDLGACWVHFNGMDRALIAAHIAASQRAALGADLGTA